MLIVLGFDSFDGQRWQNVSTPNVDSLAERGEMTTFQGLDESTLATKVLWGSMMAGENPKDLFPEFYETDGGFSVTEEGSWNRGLLNHALVQRLEKKAVQLIPSKINHLIAKQLGSHGVEKDSYVESRLETVPTVFDAATASKLISFPGVNFDESSEQLRTQFKSLFTDVSYVSENDVTPFVPDGADRPADTFERNCAVADMDRLLRTLQTMEAGGVDLLVTHFFGLDIVQHKWVTNERKMNRWYRYYDSILGQVLAETDTEDTVVVVSDHGMKTTGKHSTRAFYGSSKPIWESDDYRMEDLSKVLREEVREHAVTTPEEGSTQNVSQETQQHLADLGYF